MNNEMSDINRVVPESKNSLQECDIKPETIGPTSSKDNDMNEASLPCMAADGNKTPKKRCHGNEPAAPLHVHEVQGLLDTAQQGTDAHNHRFIVVSSDPKPLGWNNHVHEVIFCTDYHGKFCHEGWGTTSGAFPVGDGHVHFLEGITTTDDGHWHKYRIATSLDGIFV
jgi:hypothetical protein